LRSCSMARTTTTSRFRHPIQGRKTLSNPRLTPFRNSRLLPTDTRQSTDAPRPGLSLPRSNRVPISFMALGYEFVRNAALDAENYFTPAGAAKAGLRKKSVWWCDWRPDRSRQDLLLRRLRNRQNQAECHNNQHTSDRLQRQGAFATPIYDPSTGLPFPIINGQYTIPASRVDSIALKILNLLPHAQTSAATANYVYAQSRESGSAPLGLPRRPEFLELHMRVDLVIRRNLRHDPVALARETLQRHAQHPRRLSIRL